MRTNLLEQRKKDILEVMQPKMWYIKETIATLLIEVKLPNLPIIEWNLIIIEAVLLELIKEGKIEIFIPINNTIQTMYRMI